jgi:plastocyanin
MRPNAAMRLAAVCTGTLIATALPTHAQQFQDQTAARFPAPLLQEYTNQVSMVDVDGDVDLDIAFANGGGFPAQGPDQQVRLFINDGSGVFTDESIARIGILLGDWRGVEFGDVERDGDWDMVLANDNNQLPALLINNGLGSFTNETATRLPLLTLGSSRAQFGDVDNDGDLDLYFTNGTTNRFGTGRGKLYLNDGDGFYTDVTMTNTPNQNIAEPQDCIFGDVDGDFDLDIRIGSTGTNQSKLYRNIGGGVFQNVAGVPADQNCYSYDFGDINGDGDLDLLGANANGAGTNGELLLNNNGTGGYSTHPWGGSTIDDNDSKFFDWDNDGDRDIVIAAIGNPERAYLNNGANPPTYSIAANIIQAITDSSLDIKVADLTGDGRYDIVTAQGESGSFIDRIYVNVTGSVDTVPPTIINTEQIADTNDPDGPYTARVIIYDAHSSDRGFHDKGVFLNYSVGPGPVQQAEMEWVGNSMWRGSIVDTFAPDDVVNYFVTATDFANNLGTGATKSFTILHPPCPADIDGSGGVDVDDLLGIIAAWGQTVVTHEVTVIDFEFVPPTLDAKWGDSIHWTHGSGTHTVSSGVDCVLSNPVLFNVAMTSTPPNDEFTYAIPYDFGSELSYFCIPHCAAGMVGNITVAPFTADVNRDGVVDIDDLLAVIAGWGQCP